MVSLIGIVSVLFGRIINRVLFSYFGNRGSNIAFTISGTIIFFAILILIVMKYYMAAVLSVVGSIPLIISGIGLYLNNMEVVGLGILLIFIILPITTKLIKNKSDR